MAGIGFPAAKEKFQLDMQKAIYEAFKATFSLGAGDMGDEIARKFAEKGAPKIADAIVSLISQGQIVGTLNGVVTGACAVGPISGTSTNPVTGTELSII